MSSDSLTFTDFSSTILSSYPILYYKSFDVYLMLLLTFKLVRLWVSAMAVAHARSILCACFVIVVVVVSPIWRLHDVQMGLWINMNLNWLVQICSGIQKNNQTLNCRSFFTIRYTIMSCFLLLLLILSWKIHEIQNYNICWPVMLVTYNHRWSILGVEWMSKKTRKREL